MLGTGRVGPAGRLIEESGLKGCVVGGAEVSKVHANFIVNRGGATAKDVLVLISLVQQTVKAKTGYVLESEVKVIQAPMDHTSFTGTMST